MPIELTHRGLRALVDTHGGELVSLKDAEGTEYIWHGDPAYWSGRNPLLFPFVGSLKDGKVLFAGKPYAMNRHGFARDMDFALVEQREDSVLLELRETEETLARYPYPFRLQVRHTLREEGFTTALSVTNTGDTPLPFCIGAHTAFRCPLHEGEAFEDYEVVFDREETAALTLLTPQGLIRPDRREPCLVNSDRFSLDRAVFARLDTMIFEELSSTGVSLRHKERGHGVHVSFEGFPLLAFWTMSGVLSPFLCIEPWHGCAALENESGNFTDKPHCITLFPKESKKLQYSITVL